MKTESDLLFLTEVNKILEKNPDANQRDFAKSANLSLGMTNALLRRFAEKGWICMNKISTRTIRYILTPEGTKQLAKKSYHYVKNTFSLINSYKTAILAIIQQGKIAGCNRVLVQGNPEILFIIEYGASHCGLPYSECKSVSDVTKSDLVFFSDKDMYDEYLLSSQIQNDFAIDLYTFLVGLQ